MHDRNFATAPAELRPNPEPELSHGQAENKSERSEGLSSGSRAKQTTDFGDADNTTSGASSSEIEKSTTRSPEANNLSRQSCSQVIPRSKKGKLRSRLRSLFTHLSGLTHRQDATETLFMQRGSTTGKAGGGKRLSSIGSTPSISRLAEPNKQLEASVEGSGELEHARGSPLADSSILHNHFCQFDPHSNDLCLQPKLLNGSSHHCVGISPENPKDMVTAQSECRRLIPGTEEFCALCEEYCMLAEGGIDNETDRCECLHHTPVRPEFPWYWRIIKIYTHALSVKCRPLYGNATAFACSNLNGITPSCEPLQCKEAEIDSLASLTENLPQVSLHVAKLDPRGPGQGLEHTETNECHGFVRKDIDPGVSNTHALSFSHSRLEAMESPLVIPGCTAGQYEVSGISAFTTDCIQTNKKVPEIIIQCFRSDGQEANSGPSEACNLLEKGKNQGMDTLRVPDRSSRSFAEEWRHLSAEGQLTSHMEFAVRQGYLVRPPVTRGLLGRQFDVRQSFGESLGPVHSDCIGGTRDEKRFIKRMRNMDLFQPFSQSQSTESSSEADWNPTRSEDESVNCRAEEAEQTGGCVPCSPRDPTAGSCGAILGAPVAENDGRVTATHTYLPTSSVSLSRLLSGQLSGGGRHPSHSKTDEFSYLFQSSESTFDLSTSSSAFTSHPQEFSCPDDIKLAVPAWLQTDEECSVAPDSLGSKTPQDLQLSDAEGCKYTGPSVCRHLLCTPVESKSQRASPNSVDDNVVGMPEHVSLSPLCYERMRCADSNLFYEVAAAAAAVADETIYFCAQHERQDSATHEDISAKSRQLQLPTSILKSPERPRQYSELGRQKIACRQPLLEVQIDRKDLAFDTGSWAGEGEMRTKESGEFQSLPRVKLDYAKASSCRNDPLPLCKSQHLGAERESQRIATDHHNRVQNTEATPVHAREIDNTSQGRGKSVVIEACKKNSAEDTEAISAIEERFGSKNGLHAPTLRNSAPRAEVMISNDNGEQFAAYRSASPDCRSTCHTLSTELRSDLVANFSLASKTAAMTSRVSIPWQNATECAKLEDSMKDLDTSSKSPAFSIASSSHLKGKACELDQTALGVEKFHLQLEHEAIFSCITTAVEVNSLRSLTIKDSTQQGTSEENEEELGGRENALTQLDEFSIVYSAPVNCGSKALKERAAQVGNCASRGGRQICSRTVSGDGGAWSKQGFAGSTGATFCNLKNYTLSPSFTAGEQGGLQHLPASPICVLEKPVDGLAKSTDLELVQGVEQARGSPETTAASSSMSSEDPDADAQSGNTSKVPLRTEALDDKAAVKSLRRQVRRRGAKIDLSAEKAEQNEIACDIPGTEDSVPSHARQECSLRLKNDAAESCLFPKVSQATSDLIPPDSESARPRDVKTTADFHHSLPISLKNVLPDGGTHVDTFELKQGCGTESVVSLSGRTKERDKDSSSEDFKASSAKTGSDSQDRAVWSNAGNWQYEPRAGEVGGRIRSRLNGRSSSQSATVRRCSPNMDAVSPSRTLPKPLGCSRVRACVPHTQGDSCGSGMCLGQPQMHTMPYYNNKILSRLARIGESTHRPLLGEVEAEQREVESTLEDDEDSEDRTARVYTVERAYNVTAAAGKGDETGRCVLLRAAPGQLVSNYPPRLFVPFSDGEEDFQDEEAEEEEEEKDETPESLHTMSPLRYTRVFCDVETEAANGCDRGLSGRDGARRECLDCRRQERGDRELKPDLTSNRTRNTYSSRCFDYVNEFSEVVSTKVPSLATHRSLGYGISDSESVQGAPLTPPIVEQEGSRTDKQLEIRKMANGVHQPLFVLQPSTLKLTEPRAGVKPPLSTRRQLSSGTHTNIRSGVPPPGLNQLIAPDARAKVICRVIRKPPRFSGLKSPRQIDPKIRERQKRAFMKKIRQLSATRALSVDRNELRGWNVNNSCTFFNTSSKAAWRMEALVELIAKFTPLVNSGNSNQICADLIRRKKALLRKTNWHSSIVNRNNFGWDELDGSGHPASDAALFRYRSISRGAKNAVSPPLLEAAPLLLCQCAEVGMSNSRRRTDSSTRGFHELRARKNRLQHLVGQNAAASPGSGRGAHQTEPLPEEEDGQVIEPQVRRNGRPRIRSEQQVDRSWATSVLGSGDVSKSVETRLPLQGETRRKERRGLRLEEPAEEGESMGYSSTSDLPTEVRLEFENAVRQTRTVSAITSSSTTTARHEETDTYSPPDVQWQMEECKGVDPRQMESLNPPPPSAAVRKKVVPRPERSSCCAQITSTPVPPARTHRLRIQRVPFGTGLCLGVGRQVVVFGGPIKRSRPYFRRSHFARTPSTNSRHLMSSRTLTFVAIVKSKIATSRTYSLRGLRENELRRLDEYQNDVVVWTVALNTAVESYCPFNGLPNPDLNSVAQWEYCKTVTQHFVSSNPLPRGALWASW
ncbi:hypothetical protein SprV_0301071500 [Sparganum proliferum]